jgi:hypothetical protein
MANKSILSDLQIKHTRILNGINGVGKLLKSVGMDPFKLDADKILAKAARQADHSGPFPGQVEEGLSRTIESITKEGNPSPFGALAIKKLFENTVYGRLKIEQVLAANPEIEKTEIKQPVFIVGMPRTGTTILHAILNEDPRFRSPLAWECLRPYPVPRPETYYHNEQIKEIEKNFEQLFKLVPDFNKKHYMAADTPQECIGINAFDFNSFQTPVLFSMPSYIEWFNNKADKLKTMRFHKRFLQYLQSGGVKADHWLLKTPVHMIRLPELFEVYPDAKIIITHRHPFKIVPSIASLISSIRSLYSNHEDPKKTAFEQAEIWSDYFSRFLDSLNTLNKNDQITHVKFDDFVTDQIEIIKNIYRQFGWDLPNKTLVRFKTFLDENPKDKNGVHIYNLEDFGLTKEYIEEKFSNYIDFINKI